MPRDLERREPLTLGAHEAHLHALLLDPSLESTCYDRFEQVLSTDEREGLRGVERRRVERLMARVLLRTALCCYVGVEPRELRFSANAHGRPFVEAPRLEPPIELSVSHADGLVVCLVARVPQIGVDVERLGEPDMRLAERLFPATEVAALRALGPDARRARFFARWTELEAHAKACGVGLARALADHLALDPASFEIAHPEPSPDHACAVVLARGLALVRHDWRALP